MIKNTQIIWTGNEYEVADNSNSEIPEWPVQDSGARWHYKKFDGQRVHFNQEQVDFGFLAEEVPENEVPRDENGFIDADHEFFNGDIFIVGREVYR